MIKLIKPYITFNEIKNDIEKILDSGILTKGYYVDSFRTEICRYVNCKFCYLTTSATTALSTCLKIISIQPGDEVIVADFSFPASVNVIEDLGAIPIFADVDRQTFNIDPEKFENKITSRTKAVIFVDALGNPSGIHIIKKICQSHGIPLIEDAACALGSKSNDVACGNISDLTCFSFHPRKVITTGEGGAITTNNSDYAKILDIKLNHGSVVNDGKFDFVDFGYNFRMSEIQAALGICQIKKMDNIIKSRRQIYNQYIDHLKPLGFLPQIEKNNAFLNAQSVSFIVPDIISRDQLIGYLKIKGIETTIGTYCLSATTFYNARYNSVQPVSFELFKKCMTFPCFDNLDVDHVCNEVKAFINQNK